jgi:septum site-determining protein MinD
MEVYAYLDTGERLAVYVMTSGKGGVGKTTVTANLGIELAKTEKKVLLIDGDLASGNLALHFGLEKTTPALHDILSGKVKELEKAVQKLPEGVDLLPAGYSLQGFLESNIDLFPHVISEISGQYDIVLIDSPPGVSKHTLAPLRVADGAILITTPELPSISATVKMKVVVGLLERALMGAVVNRVKKPSILGRRRGMKLDELKARVDMEILGIIPEDKNVPDAIQAKRPVVLYKPRAPASKAFKELSKNFLTRR